MGYPIPFRRRFLGSDLSFGNPMQNNFGQYDFGQIEPENNDPYGTNDLTDPLQQQKETDFATAYRELLNRKDGPMMAAYRKFVEAGPPRREDYKSTKMGKLGAILSGMAAAYHNPAMGMEVVQNQLERPYRRAMEKHAVQGGYLREGANLENASVAKQLQIMNSIRETENQRRDNERADKQFALSLRTANLNMQKTLLEIINYGKRFQMDKQSGHLYMIDELNPKSKPVDMGKFDLNTGERIDESVRQARAISPIIEGRQIRQQTRAQAFSREQQARQFANDRTSVNAKDARNNLEIEAIARTDPEKYARVWGWKGETQSFELTNPLKERGIAISKEGIATDAKGVPLTNEEIADYNAFVELHNAKVKGINDERALSKLPVPSDSNKGRFEILPNQPKGQSNSRYGTGSYLG